MLSKGCYISSSGGLAFSIKKLVTANVKQEQIIPPPTHSYLKASKEELLQLSFQYVLFGQAGQLHGKSPSLPFEDFGNCREGEARDARCPQGTQEFCSGSVFLSQQVFPDSLCSFHTMSETKTLPALTLHPLTSFFLRALPPFAALNVSDKILFYKRHFTSLSFQTYGHNPALISLVP